MANNLLRTRNVGSPHASTSCASGSARQISRSLATESRGVAGDFFVAYFFFESDFFAVDFFAVDFFAVDFFAVDFFAVDFFADECAAMTSKLQISRGSLQ